MVVKALELTVDVVLSSSTVVESLSWSLVGGDVGNGREWCRSSVVTSSCGGTSSSVVVVNALELTVDVVLLSSTVVVSDVVLVRDEV